MSDTHDDEIKADMKICRDFFDLSAPSRKDERAALAALERLGEKLSAYSSALFEIEAQYQPHNFGKSSPGKCATNDPKTCPGCCAQEALGLGPDWWLDVSDLKRCPSFVNGIGTCSLPAGHKGQHECDGGRWANV